MRVRWRLYTFLFSHLQVMDVGMFLLTEARQFVDAFAIQTKHLIGYTYRVLNGTSTL